MQKQSGEDILGSKKLNYQFLLLVRDKKYLQALTLGRKILSINPDNSSVQKFCKFIEKNNSQIMEMVEREKDEQQFENDSEDSQDNQQQAGQEEDQDNQEKQQSDESDESQDSDQEDIETIEQDEAQQEQMQEQNKIQLTTCTLNSIPHVCPRHHRELIQRIQSTLQKPKTSTK